MSERVTAVWGPQYEESQDLYDFGPEHPLRPSRVILSALLAQTNGLFDLPNVSLKEPVSATRQQIETVHQRDYVDAIVRIGAGEWSRADSARWGIGPGDNPPFDGMHDAASLVAGSALSAVAALSAGSDHVWYPAGGLHHAMRARASGFCIYDDPAIAIQSLLDDGTSKVAYVDVDVHHGDGVQEIFYDDPRVLTISIHESGRYLFPGTGMVNEMGSGEALGTSVNVPLPPYTGDDAYLAAFDRVVPQLVDSFKPDVLFTQLGCDTHMTDPLAHLQLTTRAWRSLAKRLHDIAHESCGGSWIATGGGGYSIEAVPRGWATYFAEMCGGLDLSDELPEEWRIKAIEYGVVDPPRLTHDEPQPSDVTSQDVYEAAKASAEETAARLFPHHGISS